MNPKFSTAVIFGNNVLNFVFLVKPSNTDETFICLKKPISKKIFLGLIILLVFIFYLIDSFKHFFPPQRRRISKHFHQGVHMREFSLKFLSDYIEYNG
jgi:hypothetical protein